LSGVGGHHEGRGGFAPPPSYIVKKCPVVDAYVHVAEEVISLASE
jgi:hypothetical protein